MSRNGRPRVAILDYGMGNLFSVRHACAAAGLDGVVSDEAGVLSFADAVIVPGVGAFGDAMAVIRRKGLAEVLLEVAASGRPLLGICLGMQLLMSESNEFGRHRGLGIISGQVRRFRNPRGEDRALKVPNVGWRRIYSREAWEGDSLLKGVADGQYMYFVHSFYCVPEDATVVEAVADYGDTRFCAALRLGNVIGCQFHPERSGPAGLGIYVNLCNRLSKKTGERGC